MSVLLFFHTSVLSEKIHDPANSELVLLARGLGLGDAGLVWANVANLALRAGYAWAFVRRFFRARGAGAMVDWRRASPPLPVLVSFAAAGVAVRVSARAHAGVPVSLLAQKGHVALGAVCVLGCLVTW